MNVGIVGLGLIGGSLARAYKLEGHTVYGSDIEKSVVDFAVLAGAADGELTRSNITECELILIAVYPEAAVAYVNENAPFIKKGTLVIDCCGTKKLVCSACFETAKKYGFVFVGGHPMAGNKYSGFKYSNSELFSGAPMVIVPERFDDIELLERVKKALAPAHFGKFSVIDAARHDKMIAFTSQLAHVVSNVYVKSPTAKDHDGFSAGSYKDLTRVAWLNPKMWTELFMENRECLIKEIDTLTANLEKYKDALEKKDADALFELLDEGRRRKEEIDG